MSSLRCRLPQRPCRLRGGVAIRPVAMQSRASQPQPQRKTVAVIGGGLAGLVSAKCALEAGLFPTIFERRPALGGMWGDPSATYESLRTNISRFTCSFSDFPWPPSSPDFPAPSDVSKYLAAYTEALLRDNDHCRMALGCEVLHVQRISQPGGPWLVDWQRQKAVQPTTTTDATTTASKSEQHSEQFDYVIVASGFAASPQYPAIPGLDSFPGQVLHSSQYRGPRSLAGCRKVVVLGGGHSAVDIAADLAAPKATNSPAAAQGEPQAQPHSSSSNSSSNSSNNNAPGHASFNRGAGSSATVRAEGAPRTIIHVFPQPFWLVPRYLPSDAVSPAPCFAPLDLVLYRRSGRQGGDEGGECLFPTREQHRLANEYFASVCGDQGSLLGPCLAVPADSCDPPHVAISDTYGILAASGRLELHLGRVDRIEGSSLVLSDSPSRTTELIKDVDALVLCTGFRPHLPFLPPDILQTLSYTPDDNYVPLALHRGVSHPDVPGLAFVGMFRGPYFATVELQARLAAATLAGGEGALPQVEEDDAVQREGVEVELRLRAQQPRPALPHGDYVGHAESLAAAVGLLPPAEWRAAHDVLLPGDFCPVLLPPSPSKLLEKRQLAAEAKAEAAEAKAEAAEAGAAAEAGSGPTRAESMRSREAEEASATTTANPQAGAVAVAPAQQAADDVDRALRVYQSGRVVPRAVFRALHGEWVLHRTIVSCLPASPSGKVTGRASFTPRAAEVAAAAGTPSAVVARGLGGLQYLYHEEGQFAVTGGGVMRVRRDYVYGYDEGADRIDVHFAAEGGAQGGFFHSLRFLPPGGRQQPGTPQHVPPPAPAGGAGSSCGAGDGGGSCSGSNPFATIREGADGAGAAAAAATGVLAAPQSGSSGVQLTTPQQQSGSPQQQSGSPDQQQSAGGWRAVGEHLCGRDMYYASYRFAFQGVNLREFEVQFVVKGPQKDYTAIAVYTRP